MVNSSPRDIIDVFDLHRKAKCCLVLRRFEESAQVCSEYLEQRENGDRLHNNCTPFVVIGLQAYAENNQCKTAVEFANKVFGNPQKFPPVVMELCICLLLKASEYGLADELAEKWLACEENFFHQKYLDITELYIKRVLLPQGLHGKIQNFLEENKTLTSAQREVMVGSSRKLEYGSYPVGSDACEAAVDCSNPTKRQGVRCTVTARLLPVLRSVQRHCLCLRYRHWQKSIIILKILPLVFFIYTLVLAASGYQGVPSGSRMSVLWQAVLASWKAMSSAYRLT